MDRLLDPNRRVCIVRTLREPENEVTHEVMAYWAALAIVGQVLDEENVKSLKIVEIEDL